MDKPNNSVPVPESPNTEVTQIPEVNTPVAQVPSMQALSNSNSSTESRSNGLAATLTTDKTNNKTPFKVIAILMWLITVFIGIVFLIYSAFLLSSTGLFNTPQTPWVPALFYPIGLTIMLYSPWRMWRGNVWNSLGLFGTPLLLFLTTIGFSIVTFTNTKSDFNILPWLIITYFVITWILLLLNKTRIAFYIFWPLLVLTLLGRAYTDITKASTELAIILLAVAALPAYIFSILGSKFTRNWRLVTAILILAFAVLYQIFSSAQLYTTILPTSTESNSSNRTESLKKGAITEKTVDGITFKLLEHMHYISKTSIVPAPQRFTDGILIPYTQLGSACGDWVAVRPGATEILWALYGDDEFCTSPSLIQSSPENDIVAFTTLNEVFIMQISTGRKIYHETLSVRATPIIEQGVVYFTGVKTGTTGEPVNVKAFSLAKNELQWETVIPGENYGVRPEIGQDVFAITNGSLVIEVREVTTTARNQYLIDKGTGVLTKSTKTSGINLMPDASSGYYLPADDMNKNIIIEKNGVLGRPITKLQIGAKEVDLPEECLSLPVVAGNWVYCITEKSVLYFQKQ